MPLLSKPAFGPGTAITYITIGSLMDVWTVVWYMTFARDDKGNISQNTWFWLAGLFLTGLTLIVIGVLLGHIGRSARRAELPPPEAEEHEANNPPPPGAGDGRTPQSAVAGTVPAVNLLMPAGVVPAPQPMQPMQPVQPGQPGQPPRPVAPGGNKR